MLTTAKTWPIRLSVGGASWATTIGPCRFGYLLAKVAAPQRFRNLTSECDPIR